MKRHECVEHVRGDREGGRSVGQSGRVRRSCGQRERVRIVSVVALYLNTRLVLAPPFRFRLFPLLRYHG